MEYNEFKYIIFDLVYDKSRTIIGSYLNVLGKQFGVPLQDVISDFNEYTMDSSVIGN